MAYDASNLSALTYANGFTLWHYKTPDSWLEVVASGYFDEAASMLRAGDFIFVSSDILGILEAGQMAVLSNREGKVEARYAVSPSRLP